MFLVCVFLQRPNFYRFVFSPQQIVEKYLHSQDIYDPQGFIKDRTVISDSDIYLGSGYLYAIGKNPADYNFQHPPLLKYLYGYSLLFFKNPYVLQTIFGFLLIALTYLLGYKISGDQKVGALASIFLILDPLTADGIFNVYLDLG